MASAPSPNPIVGLLIPLILIVVVIWSIHRSAKRIPVFHSCPICTENIRFNLGLQGACEATSRVSTLITGSG